jgi:carbon-monoxide dehydrogenase medium subunit
MLPGRFEYVAASSLDEAVALLGEHGDDAKVLAGGQSLIPLLKLRFASPALLVDIGRIDGLDGVNEADGHLVLGTLARHNQLADDRLVADRYPLIAAAAPLIADPLVRNLGTVGGSLAHADPAGDWGSVMLALDAEVVVRGPTGERSLPIDDFLVDTFTTALEPTELLTSIMVPSPGARSGGTYLKLERKVGDFATVAAALALELGDDGRIDRAGVGLTAVSSRNVKAREAETTLVGSEPSEELFAEAARLAGAAAHPISDMRGSADYKRAVVEAYVRRGLAHCLDQARAA